jgi:hypothetical protein
MTPDEMLAADPLPLAKGARWTYDVTVKRFDPDTAKEITKSLSWTTEVVEAREANGITAFRVKGWLTDLNLDPSEQAPVATERTLLRSGNSFMFGTTTEPTVDGAEGWFSWPLVDGDKRCPQKVYCWQSAAVTDGFTLSMYTGPDEQQYQILPGTGVSRYHYAHHGSTDVVDAKLVSYSKGK